MTRSRRRLALALFASVALACRRDAPPGPVREAEFGVFFGGQIQELERLPKTLDPDRQHHGFRLRFTAPLREDLLVTWELLHPEPSQGGPRPARVGQVVAKAGRTQLDVPLSFRPSDPYGLWRAQVRAGGNLVINRDFEVVDPSGKVSPLASTRK
jgi:hypothetical protein